MAELAISEFHFIGHSGMYGIMFGTDKWPEQLPLEANEDAAGARFCPCVPRSMVRAHRRTFGVKRVLLVYDFFDSRDRLARPTILKHEKLYVVPCPARNLTEYKYSVIPMLEFSPSTESVDASYDSIAELYDQTFEDIGVRTDEWQWLTDNLGDLHGKQVLDIGCGNGALLKKLSESCHGGFKGVEWRKKYRAGRAALLGPFQLVISKDRRAVSTIC